MAQVVSDATYHAPPGWILWGGWAVLASGAAAVLYASFEIWRIGTLDDAALIMLVTANTLFIYRFGIFIAPRLGEMFEEFPSARSDPQATVNHLLGDKTVILPGFLFAAGIAFAIWQIDPWRGDRALRLGLAAFLFVNNLIVGCIILAIVRFWRAVLADLKGLDLRVLNLNRPPTITLLRINSQIVMATAFVASLAIFSVVFSNYNFDPIIVIFSTCTLLMVIATYAVPILPLSNVLAEKKAAELDRLERLIEARVRQLTGLEAQHDFTHDLTDIPDMRDLLEARDLVQRIRTLPPGGQISVSAAAIITFLSFMPSLIDYAMSKLP
ncbi:MAG: hypothetical protein ABJ360_21200 [Roseobacter sp.]